MIKKTSYKDQVYEYLKEAIIKNKLKSGEIYSEQMFADKLNVSRTPIREAVLQLKHENLIEIYNNRGVCIKAPTIDDIKQIIQARIAIEGYSVRYLTERINSPDGQIALKQLTDCLKKSKTLLVDNASHYAYMKTDVDFHNIIISFTQNMYFIKIADQMRAKLEQFTTNSLTFKNRHADALIEHQYILQAISSGDVQKAVCTLNEHLHITGSILKKIFSMK